MPHFQVRILAGDPKADRLVAAFGAKEYDYVGDMPIDFAAWRYARKPLVVAHSAGFAARVLKIVPEAEIVVTHAARTAQLRCGAAYAPVDEKPPDIRTDNRGTSV